MASDVAYSSAPDWNLPIETATLLYPGRYQLCMQDLNVLTLGFAPFVLALDHNEEISAERA